MKENFDNCVTKILSHEGGFVNHPADPGGATNMGITKETLENFIGKKVTVDDVKKLTVTQASHIYRVNYWNKMKGNDLPFGVDYAVFDFAVNSGISRAIKFLQSVVGAYEDGSIGPATIAAVNSADPAEVVTALCDKRLAFLKSLRTFKTFGKGWEKRVKSVKADALKMTTENK